MIFDRIAYMKIYRKKHKDKLKKYSIVYYNKNKEAINVNSRKRYLENIGKERMRSRKYHKNNKEKIKQYAEKNKKRIIEYKKEYRKKNKCKIKEKSKAYYQENRDNILKRQLAYQKINELKVKKYLKKYRQKKENKFKRAIKIKKRKLIDDEFNLKIRLRGRIGQAFRNYIKTGKIYNSKQYGINYKNIIEHLKPIPENLENYQIHHIKSFCSFNFINPDGSTNLKEIKKANAPENHKFLLINEHRRIHGN